LPFLNAAGAFAISARRIDADHFRGRQGQGFPAFCVPFLDDGEGPLEKLNFVRFHSMLLLAKDNSLRKGGEENEKNDGIIPGV
jgi:hypothetical protein